MNSNAKGAKATKKINKATIAASAMTAKWIDTQLSFTALTNWIVGDGKEKTQEWLDAQQVNGKSVPTITKMANKKNLAAMLRVLDARKVAKFVPTDENPQPRLYMTMKDGTMRRKFSPYYARIAANNWDQDAIDKLLDQERKAKQRKAKKAA